MSYALPTSNHPVSGGFVPLPNLVLLDNRLSRGARLLYALLKRHARQRSICWPGFASLCRDLDACEDSVRSWMRELRAADLVVQHRRGQGRTNVYMLPMPLETPLSQGKSSSPEPDFPGVLDAEKSGGKEDQEEEYQEGEFENSTPPAEIVDEEEHPARSAPPRNGTGQYDPDRDRVLFLVADIAKQLGDRASLASTTTRLLNIRRRSGASFDEFVDAFYLARSRTLERRSRQRFPYFLATLEDILGLRDNQVMAVRNEENVTKEDRLPGKMRIAHETVAEPLGDERNPRLTTDEDEALFGLAREPDSDATPSILGADETAMNEILPAPAWPMELTAMAIPDVQSYIRLCKRGPFPDAASSIAYARRRLGRPCAELSPESPIVAPPARGGR